MLNQDKVKFTKRFGKLAPAILFSVALGFSLISSKSFAQIPDVPFIAANNVDPNIMFILDDSGSMQFEILPDNYVFWGVTGGADSNSVDWVRITNYNGGACDNWNRCDYYYNNSGFVLFTFPRVENVFGNGNNYAAAYSSVASVVGLNRGTNSYTAFEALTRSAQVNTVYYDPGITYTPWSRADGTKYPNASTTCALHHPERASLGCRTMNSDITVRERWADCQQNSYTTNRCTRTYDSRTFWPATYFFKASSSSDIWSASSYTRHFIRSNQATYTGQGRDNRTDCANSANASCTYAEEIQNFANWYTYYRSRTHASQAGIGSAFSELGSNLRVGYGTINSGLSNVDGVSSSSVTRGVRPFTSDERANFLDRLYKQSIPTSGTPLRKALDDAGQYFMRTDARGPWSSTPGNLGGTELECRMSYTILMTDGYWNGDAAGTADARANVDNTQGPVIKRPDGSEYRVPREHPFRDSHSNTLADVARYYWNRDLHPTLSNKVPTSKANPAFWQHMVTFGVGLGVTGSINPTTAFNAVQTQTQISWPDPTSSDSAKIDDLLHAAVNSYGGFFSAADPITFRDELTKTLQQIVARAGSGGAIAVNSNTIQNEGATRAFATSFNSENWSGNVLAYSITESGVQTTPLWSAANRLDTRTLPRVIYMGEGSSVNQQPALVTWANMTAAQKAALESEAILNYLKGTRTGERRNGGTLRNRDSILGDIVHSAPVYNRDLSTLFVAANDGFLHAFDAVTGDERFAFLPKGVDLVQLKTLADENYTHKYFVDGEIVVTEKVQTAGKNILVGALGRGGKGLYALDVTNPSEPKYLWELNTADADMGKVLGSIVYIQLADGTPAVMVGNGYESDSGVAALFVIDIFTGNIIKKIAIASGSGLSTPTAFFAENQLHVYAGDLLGNVWKFDLSDADEDKWGVSYGTASVPAPLFVAKDEGGNVQPITAPISVAVNNSILYPNAGKRFVFFGTGSYFKSGDPNDSSTQTWYGIIDDGFQVTGRSQLNAGGVEKKANNLGYDVRSFKLVDNANLVNKKGWYIDLLDGTKKEGERIVTRSNLYYLAQPVLIASSIIPSIDPCEPGGSGYVNAINPFTGGNVTRPIFMVGSEYLIVDPKSDPEGSDIYAGSVRLRVGMPGEAVIVGNQLVAGGSDAKVESIELDLGASPENKRVLWMELIR